MTDMDMQNMLTKAGKASKFLKLVANPHRLAVLCALTERRHNVSELIKIVGIAQTSMSNHLAVLRQAELVGFERDHRELNYFIIDDRVKEILRVLYGIYCSDESEK